MAIDYEFWKFWLVVFNSASTLSVAFYLFITSRSRVNSTRLDKVEADAHQRIEKVEGHFTKVANDHRSWLERIEERHKHTPSHEDFKRMHARQDTISEELKGLKGEFKGANQTLNMIHQHLLSEGKK